MHSETKKKAKRSHPLPVAGDHWPVKTQDRNVAIVPLLRRKDHEVSTLANDVKCIYVLKSASSYASLKIKYSCAILFRRDRKIFIILFGPFLYFLDIKE